MDQHCDADGDEREELRERSRRNASTAVTRPWDRSSVVRQSLVKMAIKRHGETPKIPGALRSPWRTARLGAAAAMGSLLLVAPVTAGSVHLSGHQHAMVLLADETPIPGPHVRK